MPLLRIQTNQSVAPDAVGPLLETLTTLVAQELSKPREYVQVVFEPDRPMAFAGTLDPTAFVELRALGLPADKTQALSAALCEAVHQQLGVAPDRVFLNFADVPRTHWGWNRSTFG